MTSNGNVGIELTGASDEPLLMQGKHGTYKYGPKQLRYVTKV